MIRWWRRSWRWIAELSRNLEWSAARCRGVSHGPVWFVQEGQTLHLLPLTGSDSKWYQNVLHRPAIRVAAKRATITAIAKPVSDATKVRKIVRGFGHSWRGWSRLPQRA